MLSTEFGVANAKFRTMPTGERFTAFSDMVSIGLKWVRVDIDWRTVEPSPGLWTWSWYDDLVADANAKGLKVIFILLGPPNRERINWDNTDVKHPPRNFATFAAYCHKVVSRYAPLGVKTYEIYNEPNNNPKWTGKLYGELVKICAPIMKLADPSICILAGGSGHHDQINFLTDMYSIGTARYFDALSVHPYTYPDVPPTGALWANMSQIRQIMINNDDGEKKLWITEFGAPTGGVNSGQVTEEQQAEQYRLAMEKAKEAAYIKNLLFYTYKDFEMAGASENAENYFGIRRADGSTKPSYEAIKSFTSSV